MITANFLIRKRLTRTTASHGVSQAPVRHATLNLDKMNDLFAAQTRREQQAFKHKYGLVQSSFMRSFS
jgi:hypothetical protein